MKAYVGTLEPGPHTSDLEAYARWTTEGLKKAGLEPDGTEHRETPRGRCWVYWRKTAKGEPVFGKQPGLYVQYAERRGSTMLIFDFDMPAAQEAELLPLTWQFVRTAAPGQWREKLSAQEQAIVHDIIGEKLVELGYAVP